MFAQYEDKWVICHLKDTNNRIALKIEEDEKSNTGCYELYETGAVESDYIPLFIYCIIQMFSYGIQYYCDIVKEEFRFQMIRLSSIKTFHSKK